MSISTAKPSSTRSRLPIGVVAVALLWGAGATAQSSSCIDENAARVLLAELSGLEAKRAVVRLTGWDRIPASPGYHQAIEWLRDELEAAGLSRVRIERYGRDDPQPLRKSPSAGLPRWEVRRAELRVVEPAQRLVVTYESVPISLARYSRPTNVTAELIDVGVGTSSDAYDGVDVRGKIVLATGYSATVERLAVGEYGAAGVIIAGASSYDEHKGWGYPGMFTWQVLPPWPVDGREPAFAFSISEEAAQALRRELAAGRVTVSAVIDADVTEGPDEVLTAVIPGADGGDQEVLLLGHLDHVRPSANDNASGSAALLEIARTLHRLIESGGLARPSRSIRFLWMTEGAGTYGFLNAHPDLGDRTLAALNLDMVGEALLPGMGPLNVRRPPDSRPSYLPDVVLNLIRFLDTVRLEVPTSSVTLLNARVKPFSPDSDHYILNDGAVGIPTVFLNYGPDPFHHTNYDAPDKIDPASMVRTGFLAAASAYLVAAADAGVARRIATEVFAGAGRRLGGTSAEGFALLANVAASDRLEAYWLAERKLHHVAARERAAILSVGELSQEAVGEAQALAEAVVEIAAAHQSALLTHYVQLAGAPPGDRPLDGAESRAAGLIPRRLQPYLNERWADEIDRQSLEEAERDWLDGFLARLPQSYIRVPELLNLMDGRRTLLEVRDALSAQEFDFLRDRFGVGRTEEVNLGYRRIAMADVLRLVEIMERNQMIVLDSVAVAGGAR